MANLSGSFRCECGQKFYFLGDKIDHIKEAMRNGEGEHHRLHQVPEGQKTQRVGSSHDSRHPAPEAEAE